MSELISDLPSINYFSVVILWSHIPSFFSYDCKYLFLIEHHYKATSETVDSVAFDKIHWCSFTVKFAEIFRDFPLPANWF